MEQENKELVNRKQEDLEQDLGKHGGQGSVGQETVGLGTERLGAGG